MNVEVVKVRLPLENAPEYANVYIVNSIMIDGGFIFKKCKKLFELDVENVVITHHHLDHVGIIFWKEVNSYLNEREIVFLDMYLNPQSFTKPYIEWMKKYGIEFEFVRPLAKAVSFKKEINIKAKVNKLKSKIFGFDVLLTPGHSPGHVCIYKDKVLFSGDLILSETTTHVGYYPNYSENPMKDQINSLTKLLKLEIDVIYPAHERVIKNPEKRIFELIEHYKQRIDEVYSALENKPLKAVEIAEKIRWHHSFDKLKGWDKLLAISETLACLKYLKHVGKVKEIEHDVVKFAKV